MKMEGSVIIIGGGGSVNVYFVDYFKQDPSNPGLFVKNDDELIGVFVDSLVGVPVGIPLTKYVEGKDCVVTIHTVDDKGRPSEILVRSRPKKGATPGAIELQFEFSEFGPHPSDPLRPFYNHDRKMSGNIEILDNDTHTRITSPVSPEGLCQIKFISLKLPG